MRRLLSRQGIRYTCRLLTENSKRAFLMLVTKIQRPKILNWKKKNLLITKKKTTTKTKTRQPQAWHLRVRFPWISRLVQAIHSERRGHIPVSVACFNYSIAEVWTANTCLTTAYLANNGTCRRCEMQEADYYCSFKMLPTVRITRGGL